MIDNFVYVNGGGTGTLIRKEIYANGTYHAEDDNADGYSDVTVNIPAPVMINEKTVDDNGTYTASEEDAYGYKKVVVNLPLGSKSVTENGTYNASGDSLKGYSSFSVAVPVPDLTALSVTENGTYHPASGTVYNEVEVQVPQQTIMQRKTIYTNGLYNATTDDNVDGYYEVNVQVPSPTIINEKTITDNGTYNASDESAEGYKKVIVDVPLGSKSITANGTYNASSDSLKGFSSVTVDVPNNLVETTEAAYQQLTPAQRNNGKVYYIPMSYNTLSQDKELVDQNDTPAPTTRVTSSGSYGSNYDAEYAFNDTWFEEDTYVDDSLVAGKVWVPPSSNNNWIQYEFLQKEFIKSIEFQFIMGGGGLMVNPFVIMGSNDGTNWDTIATVPFSETRQAHYTFNVTMTVNATTPYKYVRIQSQDLTYALYIVEIQIYTDKELINETEFYLMDEKYIKDTKVNYEWYSAFNDTLVVRKNLNNNSVRWYFNGFDIPTASTFTQVPSDMTQFLNSTLNAGTMVRCETALDTYENKYSQGRITVAYIGFYNNTIRGWVESLGSNQSGVYWGILEDTDSSGKNEHVWTPPSFDPYFG